MSQSAPAILILEDTRTVQNYIRDVLRPLQSTHPILLARKLAEAQKAVETASVALFIVDIGLPDGDGIDFLCEMSLLHPTARALIITSTPTDECRERARQLGVLHFLAKPLERKTLFDAVQRLLPPARETGDGSGFEGTLGGLTPVDIIQLKCLRAMTGTVEFREAHLFGRIWFARGEIVHAECTMPGASHKGIEAFRCITTWRTGLIRDVKAPPVVQSTIATPWQQLLLESAAATAVPDAPPPRVP